MTLNLFLKKKKKIHNKDLKSINGETMINFECKHI